MFRPNFKCFLPLATFRSFCTQNSTNTTNNTRSGNRIKLIGRVKNETLQLPNGFTSFHIRTATENHGKMIGVTHNIKIKSDFAETSVPNLTNNDLVYVSGEIAYEQIKNGEKFVSVPHIFAKKIIRMTNNNNSPDDLEQLAKESINEVKLWASIGTEIHDENATIFKVVTTSDLMANLNKNFHSDWHRVLIFDEDLRQFVRNNLKISDRVLIKGEIFYNKIDLTNSRIAIQGNILPKRILKLEHFPKEDEVIEQQSN